MLRSHDEPEALVVSIPPLKAHFARAVRGLGDRNAIDATFFGYGICLGRQGELSVIASSLSSNAVRISAEIRNLDGW